MALLLYHRSNSTVVFVPPKPLVTLDQLLIADSCEAGKCTVHPVTPKSIWLNEVSCDTDASKDGKDKDVKLRQPSKAWDIAL